MFRTKFAVLKCDPCGTQRIVPRVLSDQSDAARLYNEADHTRVAIPVERIEWGVRRILKRMDEVGIRFQAGMTVIDVGCSEGMLADRIRASFGCDVTGIEVDALALEKARKLHPNTKFVHGLFQDHFGDLPKADVVIASAILEHVTHPPDFLRDLGKLLKPNGQLFILTPNTRSLNYRLIQSWWRELLSIKEHIYLFDPTSLPTVASRAGFEVSQVGTDYDQIIFCWDFRSVKNVVVTLYAIYRNAIKFVCRSLPVGLTGDILYARLGQPNRRSQD